MSNFWPVIVLRFVPLFFIIAVSIGMAFYPGGNIHNADQTGYSLSHNFLSDLGGYQSRSNEVNFISAFFFNMAMFLFASVGIAFLFVAKLFGEDPLNAGLAKVGSIFFLVGTIFFAAVGLTPYDLYLDLHIFFAVNAFRLMVPGSALYLIILLRSEVNNRYALFNATYLTCVVAYVIYQLMSGSALDSPEEMVRQASMQKLIVVATVMAVFSLSFAFQRQIDLLQARTATDPSKPSGD